MSAIDELVEELTEHERAELDFYLAQDAAEADALAARAAARRQAPEQWDKWLMTMFPRHFRGGFAPHHARYWQWLFGLQADSPTEADIEILARGGGKTTQAEGGAVALGVRGRRRYALYVRSTQDRADDAVGNIAALLETPEMATYYPEHAERRLGKFGSAKAWRRQRVWTAGGFVVDALGLDVAVRGVKLEDQRPDLIIFDDIDDKLDGPNITAKKLDIIKHSVLPAGAPNVIVIGIQNLILRNGIFSQLAKNTADFLLERRVNGPIPAVYNLKTEWRVDPKSGVRKAVITGGKASWPGGQNLEVCQSQISLWGLGAFKKEAQHEVFQSAEGVVLNFDSTKHCEDFDDEEIRSKVTTGQWKLFGGMDFGAWRFAFTLWSVDRHGVVRLVDEYFAQRVEGQASLSDRARAIHAMLEHYGATVDPDEARALKEQGRRPINCPIWGDAANPTDILEISLRFRDGWTEDGQKVRSRLRVIAVGMENKLRKVAVTRINDALERMTLRFRRSTSQEEWRLGMNAANPEGTPVEGSRLFWEMGEWSYAAPKPGEAQDQDPDDTTADGADAIASMRYAVMSWWSAVGVPKDPGVHDDDRSAGVDYKKGRVKEVPHVFDELLGKGAPRRTPQVRMPKVRR